MYTENSIYENIFRKRSIICNNIDNYTSRVKMLMEKAEICQYLITNYDTVSDEEFYEIIKKLEINSRLDYDDYRNILSLHYNKKYKGPTNVKTSMYEYIIEESGYGKDLEKHRVRSGVEISVVYTPKSIDQNHVYTKSEIRELLSKNNIVIIRANPFTSFLYEPSEEWPDFEVVGKSSWSDGMFDIKGEKYYETTLKYIKQENNIVALKRTLMSILKNLKEEMNVINKIEKVFNENDYQKRFGELETSITK